MKMELISANHDTGNDVVQVWHGEGEDKVHFTEDIARKMLEDVV